METTLWAVAESQQTLTNPTQETATQEVAQAQPQEAEPSVAENSWTSWSWAVTEAAQPQEGVKQEVPTDDLLSQVNNIINDNKSLEQVAQEAEQTQIEKENEDALKSIVEEQTKDLPSDSNTEEKTDVSSNLEESNALDEELRQGLDDIKDKKTAEDMAKKVYLAFQKERSMHQFDNEQNKNTIEVLKNMVKKLNEQVTSTDNDPRVTKLDDEMYALNKLEKAYSKDKTEISRKNLTRFYVAKLATLNPVMNANKIMELFDWQPLKSNAMGASIPVSTPVEEQKKPAPKPMWIPASKRGMY